jgi:excisionase family DNA binding protein
MEELLDVEALAAYLKVPVSRIYKWRYHGYGPPAIKVGRRLRWRPSAVDAWLTEQTDATAGAAQAG